MKGVTSDQQHGQLSVAVNRSAAHCGKTEPLHSDERPLALTRSSIPQANSTIRMQLALETARNLRADIKATS